MTIKGEAHRFGIHRLAVMEFDVGAQFDDNLFAISRCFRRQSQLRHNIELGVDIKQLVAQRGKDDAPDIGARQTGIEHIGIFRQTDAHAGLRRGHAQGQSKAPRQGQPLQ